jgi:phosphocarrier protein HPr
MLEKKFKILNDEGMHARPAGVLAKTAGGFSSTIEIIAKEKTVNAKSIMSVMGLGLTKDSEITIRVNGTDEAEAIMKIETLIANKFQL